MKVICCVFGLLFFSLVYSQNKTLQGQFTGKNLDKSFINVINLSQYKATISQRNGRFEVPAKVGDSILISSIQYSELKFLVEPEFLEEPIDVPLKLKINELQDVNVYSLGFTGNLETDADNIKLNKTENLDFGSFDISKIYDDKVNTQSEFSIRNVAMENNYIPTNFDFKKIVGLIGNLFSKKQKYSSQTLIKNPYEYSINILEDKGFFSDYLNIEANRINAFILYIDEQGLMSELLKKENKMDLIQFLLEKSKEFNKNSSTKLD